MYVCIYVYIHIYAISPNWLFCKDFILLVELNADPYNREINAYLGHSLYLPTLYAGFPYCREFTFNPVSLTHKGTARPKKQKGISLGIYLLENFQTFGRFFL